jgi:hypothetical protein
MEDRHTLTLFLSLDGNFRLNQKMKKNSDLNDVPLNKGKAYFVDGNLFQEYLDRHDDKAVQVCTTSFSDVSFRRLTLLAFFML